MGMPAIKGGPLVGAAGCTLAHESVLEDMTSSELVGLAGNGQHFAVMGAWCLYCLSNVMLKSNLVFNPQSIGTLSHTEHSEANEAAR
eukprot:4815168-Pyramimonas_sp.AAC.1